MCLSQNALSKSALPSYLIKSANVSKLRILICKRLLHTHVRNIAQMSVKRYRYFDLPILEDKRLHRIRKVDAQVGSVIVLELDVVVSILVLNDLFTELAPWREIHPGRVCD